MKNGFIGNIIIVVVALFALSLIFGIDIVGLLKHPNVLGVISAVWNAILAILSFTFDMLTFVFNFVGDRV